MMRTIGQRKERPVSFFASASLLLEGARFNDEIHRLPAGNTTHIPKGVFRFMTHAEANHQQIDCLVENICEVARRRA